MQPSALRTSSKWFYILCAVCAVLAPVLAILGTGGAGRAVLALAVVFPLLMLAAIHIRVAIVAAFAYLILLGDIRRMLIPLTGWSGTDPLLLLGAMFAVVLCGFALSKGMIKLDTPLARWTAGLMLVMVLQIFNPKQGGLVVGVAGAIFLLIPLMWFWIGRTYGSPELLKVILFKVAMPLGVAALLMGFVQVFYGYLPYQMAWYEVGGYTALGNIKVGLAPISFFSSGTEHASFLVIIGITLWAAVLRRNPTALLLLIPFVFGVLVTGSRGPMVKLLGMATVLWALLGQSRASWVPRGLLALAVCGVGLVWSLSQVGNLDLASGAQARLQRQALLLEESSGNSTVGTHTSLLVGGYRHAIRAPLGSGLGVTTKAAAKFGGGGHGTETDVGDVMMSLGIVGGVIYHVMIVLIILTAIRYWVSTRSLLALALVGILGVTFLHWLGGGYAVSSIVWFCIGSLDVLYRDRAREDEAATVHAWEAVR